MGEEQATEPVDAGTKQRAEELVGQIVSQRYRIDALIALGGMGAIFRGEHVLMRKRIAVKVLLPGAKDLPLLVERFRREAIVGAHVAHPNIASATDFGQLDDGSYFLVLEHIKGRTLYDLIKEEGPLPLDRAMGIARQIAAGLHAAHEMGIIHRDIKPHNVMLVDAVDGNRTASVPAMLLGRDIVKIIDFGLARLAEERLSMLPSERPSLALGRITLQGEIFGTIAYLAPEAATGMDAIDARGDLYALGVIMYQMLAGVHPFTETEPGPLFRRHLSTPPPPFATRAPGVEVPPEVEAIVQRLLKKLPEQRFQDAASLVAAIDEAMGLSQISRGPGRISSPAIPADVLLDAMGAVRPASEPPASAPPASAPPASAPPASGAPASRPAQGSGQASPSRGWLGGALAGLAVAVVAVGGAWSQGLLHLAAAPPGSAAPPLASGSSPVSAPSAVVSAAPAPVDPAPRAPAIASATGGPSAPPVEASAADVSSLRTRFRSAAQGKDWPSARALFLQLVRLDPPSVTDPQLQTLVCDMVTAVGQHPGADADQLFEALESQAGAAGLDVLYSVLQLRGGTRAAERATAILKKAGVMDRASKPLRAVFELRMAPCDEKPALLDRAVADGDGRVLQVFDVIRSACGSSKVYERAYRDLFARLSRSP